MMYVSSEEIIKHIMPARLEKLNINSSDQSFLELLECALELCKKRAVSIDLVEKVISKFYANLSL